MNIGAVFEATVLFDAPDGRTVFRPWGARGPCYLVEGRRGTRLRRFIRWYYGVFFASVFVLPYIGGVRAVVIAAALWLVGFYAAFLVLSRGLPLTEPPTRPTPNERAAAMQRFGRQMGQPLLWGLILLAGSMAATSLFLLFRVGVRALFPALFFSMCTAAFVAFLRRT